MFKKYRDLILGVFMLLLGIAYTYGASLIKSKLNPRFNPTFVPVNSIPLGLGVLLIVLSIFCIISGIKKAKNYVPDNNAKSFDMTGMITVLLTLAVLGLYIIILPSFGFLAATPIFLFLLMMVLAPAKERKILLFIVIAIVFTALVFVAFRLGLKQILPRGFIENLINI